MLQQAIAFNKNNADTVAAGLSDYTGSELLEEYNWMLETHTNLVLARDVLDGGWAGLSYVVTESMFSANAPKPTPELNDQTFTTVREI